MEQWAAIGHPRGVPELYRENRVLCTTAKPPLAHNQVNNKTAWFNPFTAISPYSSKPLVFIFDIQARVPECQKSKINGLYHGVKHFKQ